MYYDKKGVMRAIIDFVYSGDPEPLREGAFYSKKIGGIQRHSPNGNENANLVLDSEKNYNLALRAGAVAFYSSYWRYDDPSKASGIRGRDLVWSLKAEEGGISVAKKFANLFVESLENRGFPNPFVKYSGKLGFDFMISLEEIQTSSPYDLDFLSGVQSELTEDFLNYVQSQSSLEVDKRKSGLKLTGRMGTCLLTELRWRRGLLLAPMSLHPSSGLVSVPLSPNELLDFSVIEASPENVEPREWSIARNIPRERTNYSIQSSLNDVLLQA